MGTTYNASQVRWYRLSAEDFLKKRKSLLAESAEIKIAPPSLSDDNDYGSFLVKIEKPAYFNVDIKSAR